MQNAWNKLKLAWEQNPQQVIALGAFTALAAAKLIDASTRRHNSQTWAREVDRRSMKY